MNPQSWSQKSHLVQLLEMLSNFDDEGGWGLKTEGTTKTKGTTKGQLYYREITRMKIDKLGQLLFLPQPGDKRKNSTRKARNGPSRNEILRKLIDIIERIKMDDEALKRYKDRNDRWVREIFDDEIHLTGQNGPWLGNVPSEWIQ